MNLQQDLDQVKTLLGKYTDPVFFFDDDIDGLSAFMLLRKYLGIGKGVAIKKAPDVTNILLRKVSELNPDLVVVLDKPDLSNEFFDNVNVPIIVIDHHPIVEFPKKVIYFNPRKYDENDERPTTYWAYKISEGPKWIAGLGIVGDWCIPEFISDLTKEYKDLFPKKFSHPGDIFFNSRFGDLIKIVSFAIKGPTTEVKKAISILLKIESPYEILDKTTANGKYLHKRAENILKEYNESMKEAMKIKSKENIFIYLYSSSKTSFTSIFSNEIVYKYPDKFIIIARESKEEMKISLRSAKYNVLEILKKVLVEIEGYGGGHPHSCGCNIKKKDFNEFVSKIRELTKDEN